MLTISGFINWGGAVPKIAYPPIAVSEAACAIRPFVQDIPARYETFGKPQPALTARLGVGGISIFATKRPGDETETAAADSAGRIGFLALRSVVVALSLTASACECSSEDFLAGTISIFAGCSIAALFASAKPLARYLGKKIAGRDGTDADKGFPSGKSNP